MFEMIAEEAFDIKRGLYQYIVICGTVKEGNNKLLSGIPIVVNNPSGSTFVGKIISAERQQAGNGIAIYVPIDYGIMAIKNKKNIDAGAIIKEIQVADVDNYDDNWLWHR